MAWSLIFVAVRVPSIGIPLASRFLSWGLVLAMGLLVRGSWGVYIVIWDGLWLI